MENCRERVYNSGIHDKIPDEEGKVFHIERENNCANIVASLRVSLLSASAVFHNNCLHVRNFPSSTRIFLDVGNYEGCQS
jgi:hypothetical protein